MDASEEKTSRTQNNQEKIRSTPENLTSSSLNRAIIDNNDIGRLIDTLETAKNSPNNSIVISTILNLVKLIEAGNLAQIETQFRTRDSYLTKDPDTKVPITPENRLARTIENLLIGEPDVKNMVFLINKAIATYWTSEHLIKLKDLNLTSDIETYRLAGEYFLKHCPANSGYELKQLIDNRALVLLDDNNHGFIQIIALRNAQESNTVTHAGIIVDGYCSTFGLEATVPLVVINQYGEKLDDAQLDVVKHEKQHAETSLYWAKSGHELTVDEVCIHEVCSRLAESKIYSEVEIAEIISQYSNRLVLFRDNMNMEITQTLQLLDQEPLAESVESLTNFHAADNQKFTEKKFEFLDELKSAWVKIHEKIASGTGKQEIIKALIFAKSLKPFLE